MTTTKHPKSLRIHPLLAKLPAPDHDDPTWGSFSDNFHAAGPDVIPPLIITGNYVVDGRRRLMAAQDWQWPEIRCDEIPEDHVVGCFIDSLLGQRSISRGAKLYLVMQMLPDYIKASESRRLANLAKKRKTAEKPLISSKSEFRLPAATSESEAGKSLRTIDDICKAIGVGRSIWFQCQKVIKIFAERPEVKAEYEPQLLDGSKTIWNLWNVISGVAGADPTKDKPRPVNSVNQLELFDSALEPMVQAVKPWSKIKQDEKESILMHWRQAALKMPAEACVTLGKIFLEVAEQKSAAA